MHALTDQRVIAVGSRSAERAERFAAEFGIPESCGSYEEVTGRADVDVIYVASTHQTHASAALLAISSGKHVLIEKPFATSEQEATKVAGAARAANVLAMEAMWTRYLPQSDVIRQLLDQGAVGDVTLVAADFGFHLDYDPDHRLFDPELAGGALLDAGIYPLSFVTSVLGLPEHVDAAGTLAPTGVETQAVVSLRYSNAQGLATTSTLASLPVRASICGTAGRIDVDPPFIAASGITLTTGPGWADQPTTHWQDQTPADRYDSLSYEANAVARYVGEGRLESPVHTLAETVGIITIIDRSRSQLHTNFRGPFGAETQFDHRSPPAPV
jgi:predicted dehydrogenase